MTEVGLFGEVLKTGGSLGIVLLVVYFFSTRMFAILDDMRRENGEARKQGSELWNSYLAEAQREREAHHSETATLTISIDRLCDAQNNTAHELRELRRDVRDDISADLEDTVDDTPAAAKRRTS